MTKIHLYGLNIIKETQYVIVMNIGAAVGRHSGCPLSTLLADRDFHTRDVFPIIYFPRD